MLRNYLLKIKPVIFVQFSIIVPSA